MTPCFAIKVRRDSSGTWSLARIGKKEAPEEKSGEYNEMVIKHAMISRSCKRIMLDQEEVRTRPWSLVNRIPC